MIKNTHLTGSIRRNTNKIKFNIFKCAIPFSLAMALMIGEKPMLGASLVTEESIQRQKALTGTFKLKNGIPVIIRREASELFHAVVQFNRGLKDFPTGKKSLNDFIFSALPMASKKYSKDDVFKITSKYDLDLTCVGGIEISYCSLDTVNEAIGESLPLLASLVKEPLFSEEDVKLVKDRLVARLKNTPSEPNTYVNDVVNSVFYPKGYPYRLNHDEALAELGSLGRGDIVEFYYRDLLNAANMTVVVVSSLPSDQILSQLDNLFGDIPVKQSSPTSISPPEFNPQKAYEFIDRDVPTAFIRMKFNAPDVKDRDANASQLFYEILSKELAEEIRTKRSLSYAVHAMTIQYSVGIGILSVSTSKPKETFEAIEHVVAGMKSRQLSNDELDEYRNIFATSYYLTQETDSSMALSLSRAYRYFGDANQAYELPRQLAAVKPDDIKRLAQILLVNPRIGVIFKKDQFKDNWATDFIKKNQKKSS
jgi:predicted Zn-dependent peptidase